jgi:hypothetical protein
MDTEELRPIAGKQSKRGENATTLTTTISREDKVKLKTYAAKRGIPVSDILHEWIERECK